MKTISERFSWRTYVLFAAALIAAMLLCVCIGSVNIPLKDMRLKKDTLIPGIVRGRKTIIPAGDDVIMPGDRVIVLTAGHRMNDLADILM